MTIEIITAHEADQIARLKRPLWPTHTTCKGNCLQGRSCDCTAAVDDDDEEISQFGAFNAAPFVAAVLVAIAVVVALVLAATGRTGWLTW